MTLALQPLADVCDCAPFKAWHLSVASLQPFELVTEVRTVVSGGMVMVCCQSVLRSH